VGDRALSHYTSMKRVSYRPTHRHTKLLSLGISYVPYVPVHFKFLFNRAQPTRALIDTSGGYHLRALNIRSDHSSSFPSSILHFPLIALPALQLCQPFDHLAIASGVQPLIFYRYPTLLSIAYYRYISFVGVNKVV
jgi:hypothetical protein